MSVSLGYAISLSLKVLYSALCFSEMHCIMKQCICCTSNNKDLVYVYQKTISGSLVQRQSYNTQSTVQNQAFPKVQLWTEHYFKTSPERGDSSSISCISLGQNTHSGIDLCGLNSFDFLKKFKLVPSSSPQNVPILGLP